MDRINIILDTSEVVISGPADVLEIQMLKPWLAKKNLKKKPKGKINRYKKEKYDV